MHHVTVSTKYIKISPPVTPEKKKINSSRGTRFKQPLFPTCKQNGISEETQRNALVNETSTFDAREECHELNRPVSHMER